ncbi:MAG TPA: DegT/DnrJ/EryC1/StrS family aminotransferase [Candidatus Paceibacterota bacterium]
MKSDSQKNFSVTTTGLAKHHARLITKVALAFREIEKREENRKTKPSIDSIPLASPDITASEIEAVLAVLATPNLSLGPKLKEFEEKIAAYTGTKYAVAVNSGTSALHLIIKAMGIGPGDEVITTPFSFVASSNCIIFEGAKPIFVDIDPVSYNIDPSKIEGKITPRTKAILAVDVFGRPADWKELHRIAKKHKLLLIEDSAEAIGSVYYGKKAGSYGDAAIFAFYPNKQITTGEGGVITTNNSHLAELCASMRNQGHSVRGSWLEHPRLGYNYRISDINCALGIAQLARIDEIVTKRARVAKWYNQTLKNIPGLTVPALTMPNTKISWFVYVVRLADAYTRKDRARIMLGLKKHGIGCREYFPVIHLQKYFREEHDHQAGSFPIAEHVSDRTIALPFHNNLSQEEVRRVAGTLKTLLA